MPLAPIQDYATLQAAVIAMADRSDPDYVNAVPVFIQQAERRLYRGLRCPGNEEIAIYPAEDGDNTGGIALSTNYLECRTLMYSGHLLERISDQRMLLLRHNSPTVGTPQYFARVADALYFWPIAGENADVEMVFYASQGPVADTDVTRMLLICPFAYVYGALAEGARFTRDEKMEQVWETRFGAEIAEVMRQAQDNEVSGNTVVVSDIGGGW
jgi:hypothetical protein